MSITELLSSRRLKVLIQNAWFSLMKLEHILDSPDYLLEHYVVNALLGALHEIGGKHYL